MQNSALFRRGVVLAMDDRAEEALRSNGAVLTTRVRHLRIPNDAFFEKLWQSGLFHEINQHCATLIDDYEEAFVEAPSIPDLVAAIESAIRETALPDLMAFLLELHELAITAFQLRRPLLFVL